MLKSPLLELIFLSEYWEAKPSKSFRSSSFIRVGNPVARGNHEVLVKVKLPTRITDEERELLEGLASQYSDKNINSSTGLFSKLFGKDS